MSRITIAVLLSILAIFDPTRCVCVPSARSIDCPCCVAQADCRDGEKIGGAAETHQEAGGSTARSCCAAPEHERSTAPSDDGCACGTIKQTEAAAQTSLPSIAVPDPAPLAILPSDQPAVASSPHVSRIRWAIWSTAPPTAAIQLLAPRSPPPCC